MKAKGSILVVDDEEIVRDSLARWLEEDGYQVDTAPDGQAALAKLAAQAYAILLVDLKMPGIDGLQVLAQARTLQPDAAIIIMTAYATVDTAVQAMKQGAYDYLVKPFEPEELSLMVGKLTNTQALRRENVLLRKALKRQCEFKDLVSKSPKMEAVFELARTAAKSNSTVLILGGSGTGKELLARAIHAESLRREGPFVGVSCAALTESLLESELFGHEKGAFTGAVGSARGKFEIAAGGTLFLDEIGDISPKLQLDLLRVLDAREFRRVGGSQVIKTDARIIAATNRDLKKLVDSGSFREDLYYRLNVIPVTLPPLRERKEDIPLLAEHFLAQFRTEMRKPLESLSGEALEMLMAYDWPGNVRELRNVLERGAVLARGPILTPLGLELGPPTLPPGAPTDTPDSLREVERRHIEVTLKQHNWNITRAAKALGIDRVTLYNKIKRYQIREDE
ncbi:MAG: Fis family transcriptional regulator [candidate division NC10 bacterium RIFCSPLOWO2_12_FULL_66_18]|nr:MAG: Fis family transcriptional regulator [candidate division NC10 bacterium RIFCSPLOWO2_12_FULL_66_18]